MKKHHTTHEIQCPAISMLNVCHHHHSSNTVLCLIHPVRGTLNQLQVDVKIMMPVSPGCFL